MAAASGVAATSLMEAISIFRLVDWKAPQIREARVAGAEVAYRNFHALLPQTRQARERALGVRHEQTLSQFEFQSFRCNSVARQSQHDVCSYIAFDELTLRHIDRYLDLSERRPHPLADLPADGVDHPMTYPRDQTALLHFGDESARRDRAMTRSLPS